MGIDAPMTKHEKQKLVVICGPTGIGKTELSLSLAETFNGAIVSADSMQIYRYMDIGTAKPDAEEMRRVAHYLIDIVDPDTPYDAAAFYRDGREAIASIFENGRQPFVVGGTGFYQKALLHGLFDAKKVDPNILAELKAEAAQQGILPLYERLAVHDPAAADRIHVNDAYRVIRALAVFETTGKPMSEFQKAHQFKDSPFFVLKICLFSDRDILYSRINQRVDRMVAMGFLEEVQKLREMGYAETLRPMQSIGYRHMNDFISGRMNWEDTLELLKRDTRRFAKRQFTWFRKDPEMVWRSPDAAEEIAEMVDGFLGESLVNI
jgi:tRNA dimethylallyltransferase